MMPTNVLSTFTIELLQFLIKDSLLFEFLERLVQPESRPRIFDRIVRIRLDILPQNVPRQEAQ